MRVSEKTRPVLTCGADETLDEAARLICESGGAAVDIVEGGRFVGVITAMDVCLWAYTTGEALWAIPLRKVLAQRARPAPEQAAA
jgi:predicted transcriptional regulator